MPKQEQEKKAPLVATGDTHADDPYVGVDPIYQNHASDTEKPFVAEGEEGELEKKAREAEQQAREEATKLATGPAEPAEEKEQPKQTSSVRREQAAKASE